LKQVSPRILLLVLLGSIMMVFLLLIIPSKITNGISVFSFPSENDFLPLEVEKVNTIYASVPLLTLLDVEESHDYQKVQPKFNALPEDEKIIHSSDFTNDLASFYFALNSLSSSDTLLRILHFGDSQIEGDRVSGKLRQSFQNIFGGCGTGFMPISEHRVYRLNVLKQVSGWKRYKVFGSKPDGLHNRYGFLGYYHGMDTLKENSYIQIQKSKRYFSGVSRAEKFTVLYRAKSEYKGTDVSINNHKQSFGYEVKEGLVRSRSWYLDSFPNNSLSVQFKHQKDIEFYGISLDCKSGVALDNVGLRGSSGTEFTKIDEVTLRNQLQLLNANLIVYQFGVNVIPHIVDDYKFYENMVYRQLKLFKKLAPNASILVVGVSDMCQKNEGEFKSFPNIKKVILAQRNAALRAKCSFWDLQKVMGGEGSMKNWVNAKPPLGEKDYTHFNKRGANLVGEKLFSALMSDYYSHNELTQ